MIPLLLLLAAGVVWPFAVVPAAAAGDFRPRVAVQALLPNEGSAAAVVVNGRPFAVIRTASEGHSPEMRAQEIAERLECLIAHGLAPGDVDACRVDKHAWSLRAGDSPVLLVSPQEAAAHGMSAEDLARSWAKSLRALLAEPPISSSAAGLVVPVGETRTVDIGGAAEADDITCADQDPQITQSRLDMRSVCIRGLSPGRSAVRLAADGATIDMPVSVMDYAARIAPAVTVNVTGDPGAPENLLRKAVYAGIASAVDAQPGAAVTTTQGLQGLPEQLPPGAQTTATIPVHAEGADLLPCDSNVTVTIVNEPTPARRAAMLFYSNDPETVRRQETLFDHNLELDQSIRLDYHHVNGSGSPFVFHVDLVNDTDKSAAVQVISGASLPGADTMMVGLRAGAAFLAALDSNAGIVRRIAPHTRAPLVVQRVASGLTVSGVVQLCQIEGPRDAVHVRISADDDDSALMSPVGRVISAFLADSIDTSPWPDQPAALTSGPSAPPASHVYGSPVIRMSASYTVGGKWAFISIGRLRTGYGNRTDGFWDNYGADYHISIILKNPRSTCVPVGLYFAPEAGEAAGVFRVNGGPVQEFDPTQPSSEQPIAKFVLQPGETQAVLVHTVPLNGSYYPVSLIAHD
jgi:hypothetical protein